MKKDNSKEIAMKRIQQLFKEAESIFKENKNLSNRYVQLARKIAMKVRIIIPRELKRKYCKHCYSYLKPGVNCRVRNYKSRIVYYCENCKKYMRFVIKKKL